jgi:HK97 family phage portal protein
MANIFTAAWSALRGEHLPGREVKFAPGDPTVNWQYVNHLVYTANTTRYGGEGTGDGNSAVFACLLALSLGSIEPPLAVWKKDTAHGGEFEPQPDHPMQAFLDNPNPELDMLDLRFLMSWMKHCDGNAYLIKVRSGDATAGLPLSLWPVSPSRMEPKTARGSKNLIDYYEYRNENDEPVAIPTENVIPFTLGRDPRDPRKGLSPLKRLLREISSDAEATAFMDALLNNFGVPGLAVEVPADVQLNPDQIRSMKDSIAEAYNSGNRGKVGVITGGATMKQFGFNPEQMNLKALHDFPETRIAAVMGVDPLIARLGVGLEQSSNYASARQVRENFTELTLVPLWKMDEAKWNRKLTPDFTTDKTIVIKHDLGEVRSMQEDENSKATRLAELVKAGIIPVQVAARELGYDPEWSPESLFYVSPNVTFVSEQNIETNPAEVRQQQADAQAARAQALAQPNANNANAQADNNQPPGAQGGKAANVVSEALDAFVDAMADGFTADLERLQSAQEKRLKAALVKKGEGSIVQAHSPAIQQ